MALDRSWNRDFRKLAGLLVSVTVPPLIVLVWLGTIVVRGDRTQAERRLAEERQLAIRTVAQTLDRGLVGLERHLTAGPLPSGLTRLRVSDGRVIADPADRVLWLPATTPVWPSQTFVRGDSVAQAGRVDEARAIYSDLARAGDGDIRAGALVRMARLSLQAGRPDEALADYERLLTLPLARVAGAPADLIARRAAAAALDGLGRRESLAQAAATIRAGLEEGRWPVDEATWELTADDFERWTGAALPVDPERRLMSRAADRLSAQPLALEGESVRRAVVVVDDVPLTVIARSRSGATEILILSSDAIESLRQTASASTRLASGGLVLLDDQGQVVSGTHGIASPTLSPAETGLPWTVGLGPEDPQALEARLGGRRRLFVSGLAMVLVFVVGAGVFLWRLVQRALAVSQLQSEFVAAVSHEFRTPLTSLRLAWEVLDGSDTVPPDERRSLYGSIGRNSERLQRLVESLLDLSRMESGRRPYELTPLDAGLLAREVVADFQREAATTPFTVDVIDDGCASYTIPGDRSALGHALRNLLENAVKYSTVGAPVAVVVRPEGDGVAIAVSDQGIGIPVAERRAIFGRFVRGQHARQSGVRGTGLGLAIVSHIVAAHGGSVTVDSVAGQGSTFTIRLPGAHTHDRLPSAAALV